ncbi:hypothetical protein [Methanolobus sp. WCC4]|uniref:hypothetical protein n=1 Tax=Methanolobus sp. WCC4 TaxID=3125784 RepID=UPI0030FB48C4
MVNGVTNIWFTILKNNFQMLGLDRSKPRGIIILGILIGIGAIGQLIMGLTGQSIAILGGVLQADAALFAYMFYALVSAGISYGFLKLKKTVFYLSILWFLWGATNGTSNYLALDNYEMLADGVLSIVFLAYIISKKVYFVN